MAGTDPGENGVSPAVSPTPDGASETSQTQDSRSAGSGGHGHGPVMALTVGAIGVVFGDIGTSPLYAMREALSKLTIADLLDQDPASLAAIAPHASGPVAA